ncbi:MAG: hypothetical protein HY898_18040 [Deltaproteobacteria bacterium]|nr:hypothetical protein [Deltaproteobacteria bacterium]
MRFARWMLPALATAAIAAGWARPALADPPVRMAPHDLVAPANFVTPSPAMMPAMVVTLHAPRTVSTPAIAVPDANLVVPISASTTPTVSHPIENVSAAEMIQRIGSLQFLSATIIPARKEVVVVGDHTAITQITPSLRIAPTFVGKTYGLTAIATF